MRTSIRGDGRGSRPNVERPSEIGSGIQVLCVIKATMSEKLQPKRPCPYPKLRTES